MPARPRLRTNLPHAPLCGSHPPALRSLRAALNSTQGLGAEPFFLPGATPASADPLASGGHGGALGGAGARGRRASSLLRRDSESGMASEK